ncbi:hypothetical protein AVEN_59076-1 [Araneus ventricosus]|uniref:Uncharacterized protein n=1 Tax=Araneus ventricosus TaxID=182803 RepID=A0A4Y2W9U6_ARAVE|nr:hypothetical protein AVEN_59076-1 [Araneus ventricosus]
MITHLEEEPANYRKPHQMADSTHHNHENTTTYSCKRKHLDEFFYVVELSDDWNADVPAGSIQELRIPWKCHLQALATIQDVSRCYSTGRPPRFNARWGQAFGSYQKKQTGTQRGPVVSSLQLPVRQFQRQTSITDLRAH